MADETLVSVIVAVKGDCRIYRLVDSLLAQSLPAGSFEVVVVENGSSQFADVTSRGSGQVRYLHLAEGNMAAARNAGLNAACGRYLLLTDADCIAEPEWVERMTACLAEGRYGAVGGSIVKFAPTTWTQRHAITVADGQAQLSYLPALPLPYVAGANAGYVTAALREVGGFDERLRSGNDVDICYRLGMADHQIGLVSQAVVWHEDRASVRAHFRRFRGYAVYQVLLFVTYQPVTGRRFVLNPYPLRRTAEAIADIPRALLALARGDAGPGARALLQLVEAAGVWCGDLEGSVRYRALYI
jgi:GT2 family glycosyltransferase